MGQWRLNRNAIRRDAVLVFGGQAGSEGKGKVCADIALHGLPNFGIPDLAVCAFMTNAGHTAYLKDGRKVVVQQLPIAAINPDIELFIGPGAAITLDQLNAEIEMFEEMGLSVENRLKIHPRAVIISHFHRQQEAMVTKRVASTMKGCGAALAGKALREPNTMLFQDVAAGKYGTAYTPLKRFLSDTTNDILDAMSHGLKLLIEGSQGFDLDVNLGLQYPNCTSRMANPSSILADCGMPLSLEPFVIATVRTYPIRVGNVVEGGETVGFSGDYPSPELDWPTIECRGGWPKDSVLEKTTVTQRIRRVFEFSHQRFDDMLYQTRPDGVALMFADYLSHDIHGLRSATGLDGIIRNHDGAKQFFTRLCETLRRRETGLTHIGTGPQFNDMVRFIDREDMIPFHHLKEE